MNPDEHTIQELFVDVGHGHQLYVQDWGNPKAPPAIFLHGGPGGGVKNNHRAPFDPTRHRVIFFDQRGCGKSLPYGSLEHNTTPDLVEDITKIADQLKLKQFVLVGGSWGPTLALAYAIKYPKRVKAMVLSGIFTGSRSELDWLEQGLFRTHFPDVWEAYLAKTPKSHQANPAAYHYKNVLGNNERAVKRSGMALQSLEGSVMNLDDRVKPIDPETFDPTDIRTEVHYLANNCFLPDRYILKNAHKLQMPVFLVQGRYDMVCPPMVAYELHQRLPNSHLFWTVANHRTEHEIETVVKSILLQFGVNPHV
jgi:proline iminopeptidase